MGEERTGGPAQESGGGAETGQYLTFSLADEEYGVEILKVQEIKGYVPTTRIPNSPPEVMGVLNLRGTIVPIVDLRRKFGLPEVEHDQFAAIVVVVVHGKVMGLLVDRVSEVMSIPASDIRPPSEFTGGTDRSVMTGIGKVEDKLVILLDVDTLLLDDTIEAELAEAKAA